MKSTEERKTSENLFCSPEKSIRTMSPVASPFSKFVEGYLTPIWLSSPCPYRPISIPSPRSPGELLQVFPDISYPSKHIKKLDFSSFSNTSFIKFGSVSAKVTIAQELETSPLPAKRVRKQRKEENHTEKICCNCQKSRCLKLYCDCFKARTYCDGCSCVDCLNNQFNESLRKDAIAATLDRNPNAFESKIKTVSLRGEIQIMHNKGCHCSKSGCQKNYCVCFESKIACTENCQCTGCKNCEDLYKGKEFVRC